MSATESGVPNKRTNIAGSTDPIRTETLEVVRNHDDHPTGLQPRIADYGFDIDVCGLDLYATQEWMTMLQSCITLGVFCIKIRFDSYLLSTAKLRLLRCVLRYMTGGGIPYSDCPRTNISVILTLHTNQ